MFRIDFAQEGEERALMLFMYKACVKTWNNEVINIQENSD